MFSPRNLLVLGLATAGAAFPNPRYWRYAKRDGAALTDADILNFALTLEHLEDKFYREGLANFTQSDFAAAGYDATFYANLKEVSSDETTHVKFLTDALTAAGASPVAECTYAFGVTDVASFIATASILEGVGVSAYLGAAASISNPAYLTAAGSILTIEARHSSYLRAALKEIPFPQPFDDPLSPNSVYTLASPFITGCPDSNGALPFKSFPAIAVTSTDKITTGSKITVKTSGFVLKPSGSDAQLYAAFATITGPVYGTLTASGDGQTFTVTVPAGVAGQSYLVFTNCNETMLLDSSIVAGPALLEISS